MDYFIMLIIGVILGWLLSWATEPLFRRQRAGALEGEALDPLDMLALQQRVSVIEAALSGSAAGNGNPAAGRKITKVILKNKDDLESIHGIGPVFAQRLNEAGVYTFEQLGRLSVAQVKQIIAVDDWQEVDVDSWIAAAQASAADLTT